MGPSFSKGFGSRGWDKKLGLVENWGVVGELRGAGPTIENHPRVAKCLQEMVGRNFSKKSAYKVGRH